MTKKSAKKPNTDAARTATYYNKQREKGLVRLSVWVPNAPAERDRFWVEYDKLKARWQKDGLI